MAWAEVGVAATEPQHARAPVGTLLAAALTLPGIVPAYAQSAPDKGIFELQYLNYRDWQPGKNRMTVDAPAFYALLPVTDTVVVEGGMVYDSMSGASPLFFNTLSGASVFDYRTAGDLKVTKYYPGYSVSVGGFVSSEQDFLSRGGSVNVQIYSDDRNRTWALGVAGTNDRINATNGIAPNSHRNSLEFLVGVTQALTANSIIQSNLTYYTGHGYYSDPYKSLDTRPSDRNTLAWLTRYNQYFPDADGTLKLGYRLLFDSFGSTTNMIEAAWAQALPYGFTLTPGLRYYTQSAARDGLNNGGIRLAVRFPLDVSGETFRTVVDSPGALKSRPRSGNQACRECCRSCRHRIALNDNRVGTGFFRRKRGTQSGRAGPDNEQRQLRFEFRGGCTDDHTHGLPGSRNAADIEESHRVRTASDLRRYLPRAGPTTFPLSNTRSPRKKVLFTRPRSSMPSKGE